jgi:hypothetical protein
MGIAEAEADLDWQEFSAKYFPGSRRHNLQALVAYGAYKRSHAVHGVPAHVPERARNGAAERAAVQAWEDEGGRSG